jgi:hypothetical protein
MQIVSNFISGGEMAEQESKGSVLYKIIIVVLVFVIYLVIMIPGKIWDQELNDAKVCRANMLTLYEAHNYYHKLTNTNTTNFNELLNIIQKDSTLQLRNNIVKRTLRLRDAMETFLNVPIVKNTNRISMYLKNIQEDLINNERYFRMQDAQVLKGKILERSEDLKVRISTIRSGTGYENFQTVVIVLDSLWQMRRDLTDISLQSAARRASAYAEAISRDIISIDFRAMNRNWIPLLNDLTSLNNSILSIEALRSQTTVADRLKEFQEEIGDGFNIINQTSSATNAQQLSRAVTDLNLTYQEFLVDFLVTEKLSQYALSEVDSLLLALNEKNFYTPGTRLPYLITFMDTLGLQVEDPTLVNELRTKAQVVVPDMEALPFLSAFSEYSSTLDSLHSYYLMIKADYRRNLYITIATKELDVVIPRVKDSQAFKSYSSLQSFVNDIPNSNSYYQIKKETEESLVGIKNFQQIYKEKIFGTLDSMHVQIIRLLNEFESLLTETKGNTYSMNGYMTRLSQLLERIKSVPYSNIQSSLQKTEKNLEELFLFASKGKEKRVYGVFTTTIVNHGKVYGRSARKSWEEKTE